MSSTEWRVTVGSDETSAVYEPPTVGEQSAVFICAHGAGGSISDRGTLSSANAMRRHGIGVVRFNFLYRERKFGRPDTMPKLMATFAAVAERVRAELVPARLVIGGRSMGGRTASMLAAEGFDADGLLLLAYPLHPPGQPEKLRAGHLPDIRMPVVAFCGTRDPFISRVLMDKVLADVVAPWDMHWVETADHSFHVLKSSGRTDAEVMDDIGRVSGAWARR